MSFLELLAYFCTRRAHPQLCTFSVTDDNCSVTALHPTFLTETGGRLYNEMANVKINCNCANQGDTIWYYPNGTSIPLQLPSFTQIMQVNGTLIIPIFTQVYEGTYYCWVNGSSFGSYSTLEMLYGR